MHHTLLKPTDEYFRLVESTISPTSFNWDEDFPDLKVGAGENAENPQRVTPTSQVQGGGSGFDLCCWQRELWFPAFFFVVKLLGAMEHETQNTMNLDVNLVPLDNPSDDSEHVPTSFPCEAMYLEGLVDGPVNRFRELLDKGGQRWRSGETLWSP
ncbi:hypothetical protein HAX54_001750 [Datura stramonium]|uniref:Uncharacterized protein n=1 Tax=Datura stramonium TaxID=4076 RepID=A0ABS8RT84_DATST|nr:hypothetical protein [Datura stramonium]